MAALMQRWEHCASLCFGRAGPVARKGAELEYLLLNKLQQRRNELKKIIRKTEASAKRAPDGILKYGRRKNTLDYYLESAGSRALQLYSQKESEIRGCAGTEEL